MTQKQNSVPRRFYLILAATMCPLPAAWMVSATFFVCAACRAAAPLSPELCTPQESPETLQRRAKILESEPKSTRDMAALLQQIRHSADPLLNPYRSAEQVPLLRASIAAVSDFKRQYPLKTALARQLLQAGESEQALKEYEEIIRGFRTNGIPLEGKLLADLLAARALCYLRIGEQENCLGGHNADSCLFPIKNGGVYQLPQGPRAAIGVLMQLLERFPNDLRGRWLLNIAYMTLGEYPAKVPPKYLLSPSLFQSDYDIKRFPDVAAKVGLDHDGLAGGVVFEDFDHDGLLDLMVSAWGLDDQLRVYRNNGDGTFTERTEQAGIIGEVGGLNLIQGDYNNDGFADVLVLRGAWLGHEGCYPFSLLRNNGDFTFTDVTAEAKLMHFRPTQSAVWWDYDGDGWLDIFVANESSRDHPFPCELFRNNGDGTFTECAARQGLDFVSFFKGVACGDYNNDGRPDLFLSRLGGPKLLLRNDGPAGADRSPGCPWRFTEVAAVAGVTEPNSTFPCWFWDYNNDGWLDIFVTGRGLRDLGDIAADYLGRPHQSERARLYRNNGDGTFTDVSAETGMDKLLLAMGCNFGDLDNDGWLDCYIGTGDPELSTLIPHRMFRNDAGQHFQDVTTSGGFGQLQKGHAIAFGDIDNDGDQDIFSVVGGAYEADHYHSQLFLNPGHGNYWLKLVLVGTKTNRVALGARIKVVVDVGGTERAIHRVVGSGGSFGASSLRQEIGLGTATLIKRVEIYWPVSGETQTIINLAPNHCYRITEGNTAAEPVELKRFSLEN